MKKTKSQSYKRPDAGRDLGGRNSRRGAAPGPGSPLCAHIRQTCQGQSFHQAPSPHSFPNQDMGFSIAISGLGTIKQPLEPLLVGWGHQKEPAASLEHIRVLPGCASRATASVVTEPSSEAPSTALLHEM